MVSVAVWYLWGCVSRMACMVFVAVCEERVMAAGVFVGGGRCCGQVYHNEPRRWCQRCINCVV